MKILLYTPGDNNRHKELGRLLQSLPDGDYVIQVKKNRPVRSLKANAYYWMCVKIYSIHTGHHESEIDYMFRMDRHYQMKVINGREVKVPKETKDLDTKEYADFVSKFLAWGRENFPEVIIPRPEDATYLQWVQVNNDYNESFSGY